jgi:hypothetical protein
LINRPIDVVESAAKGDKSGKSKFLKELQNYIDSQTFKSEWTEEVEKSKIEKMEQ